MYEYVEVKWERKKWSSFGIIKRDEIGGLSAVGWHRGDAYPLPLPPPAVEKAAHRVMSSGELSCPSLGRAGLTPHLLSSVMRAQVKRWVEGGEWRRQL